MFLFQNICCKNLSTRAWTLQVWLWVLQSFHNTHFFTKLKMGVLQKISTPKTNIQGYFWCWTAPTQRKVGNSGLYTPKRRGNSAPPILIPQFGFTYLYLYRSNMHSWLPQIPQSRTILDGCSKEIVPQYIDPRDQYGLNIVDSLPFNYLRYAVQDHLESQNPRKLPSKAWLLNVCHVEYVLGRCQKCQFLEISIFGLYWTKTKKCQGSY